jgi:hypothetical protein
VPEERDNPPAPPMDKRQDGMFIFFLASTPPRLFGVPLHTDLDPRTNLIADADPPFRDPRMDQIYPPAPKTPVPDPPSRDPLMDQIYRPAPTAVSEVFEAVVNDLIGGDLLDPFGSHGELYN